MKHMTRAEMHALAQAQNAGLNQGLGNITPEQVRAAEQRFEAQQIQQIGGSPFRGRSADEFRAEGAAEEREACAVLAESHGFEHLAKIIRGRSPQSGNGNE